MASDSALGTPTIRRVKPRKNKLNVQGRNIYIPKSEHTVVDVDAFPARHRVDTDHWVDCLDFLSANGKACRSVSVCLEGSTMHRCEALQVGLEPWAQ